MGGQDGNRGYLVQAIIAFLQSLVDSDWDSVWLEPDETAQKVDILWRGAAGTKVVQVKSSINQIGKADAERWAAELRNGTEADKYALVLIGPCAQSVVDMGSFQGVSIPCPKSLDVEGLLHEAAHALDKFLGSEGLDSRSATQREVMVQALTTRLSALSTRFKPYSRTEFIALLREWVSAFTEPVGNVWEQVSFERQRGIESAVAGKRLGPSDVEACPEFAICDEVVAELTRSHLYEIVGTPGCGKSITGWHVAKRLHSAGFTVWRPRTYATAEELVASLPRTARRLLVVDDAHQFGRPFAGRLSESSGPETKVLLISTVQDPLLSNTICISPARCVEQLADALLKRRDEVLPIIQQYDKRVSNNYLDTPYEWRLQQARRESRPWELFWVLRGGWQAARREFESVEQFPHAADVLLLIAIAQITSCDAGVDQGWIAQNAQRAGVGDRARETALRHLQRLGLVLDEEPIRTKHISYAYRIVEESFRHSHFQEWARFIAIFRDCVLDSLWSLKGVSWALDAACHTDAFRWKQHSEFEALREPLTQRCLLEQDDLDWAAGCFSRLVSAFEGGTERIMNHRAVILRWVTSQCGLVSYFCSNIINELINLANSASDGLARQFLDDIDVTRLISVANATDAENLHNSGKLLDRLGFYGPKWAAQFLEGWEWPRAREMLLTADVDHAYAVDAFVTGISLLARDDRDRCLRYVEETVPYIVRAINARPCDALTELHGVFWTCLGYAPRFLRGGRAPDGDQKRIAAQIVAQLEPQTFARALERAIPRVLEELARAFETIQEIDHGFAARVASCLSQHKFLKATRCEWKAQSAALLHILPFFCIGEGFEPAASWVRQNKEHIDGALNVLFVCIAPDVAIEFRRANKAIEIGNPRNVEWRHTSFAIRRLAALNQSLCIDIVNGEFSNLRTAVYTLTLDSPRDTLRFFRALFELSADLFNRFVDSLDLDDPKARETIGRLIGSQRRELPGYQELARCGRRVGGRVAELSEDLLRRLAEAPKE